MKASAVVDIAGILEVKKTYEQAEHELDRMADAGILSTSEVTNARRNLHQEEDEAIEEVIKETKPKGGGDDKRKPDKPKKTRQTPHKTKTTKTKTKTNTKTKTSTAASRASAAAAAAALSRGRSASKAHKTRMSRVVDPWAFEDKRGGRR